METRTEIMGFSNNKMIESTTVKLIWLQSISDARRGVSFDRSALILILDLDSGRTLSTLKRTGAQKLAFVERTAKSDQWGVTNKLAGFMTLATGVMLLRSWRC